MVRLGLELNAVALSWFSDRRPNAHAGVPRLQLQGRLHERRKGSQQRTAT